MRAVSFIAALILLLPVVAFAGDISAPQHVQQKHEEMLYPTVLVRAGQGTGSGTVIFSEERDGEYLSLVLTNHHVVKLSLIHI